MKITSRTLLFSLLITSSCKFKNDVKFNNYYDVIDDFIRMQLIDSSRIISLKMIKVVKDTFDYEKYLLNADPSSPPPLAPGPPMGVVSISKHQLKLFFNQGLIDSLDIDYMFNQIENVSDSLLISNKINHRTLSQETLDSIRVQYSSDDFFNKLEKSYNASSIIKFSTPLVSLNSKTLIFNIEHYCGSLCGSGYRYIVTKEKQKWRIKYKKRTWVS